MKTKEKQTKKYNPVGSLLWALRNMWKHDRIYLLSFFLFIPISIISRIAGDYFPKVLIDALGAGQAFSKLTELIILY